MRPTTSRVREAMFSLVEARIKLRDARVMDLFAGTGALAFEALSRGAGCAILVEADKNAIRLARRNSAALDVRRRCRFIQSEAFVYLKQFREDPVSLILADPPYDLANLENLPEIALKCVHPGGFIVLEHGARVSFDGISSLETTRAYGRTRVSVFKA